MKNRKKNTYFCTFLDDCGGLVDSFYVKSRNASTAERSARRAFYRWNSYISLRGLTVDIVRS
jgi:hypothetical protein